MLKSELRNMTAALPDRNNNSLEMCSYYSFITQHFTDLSIKVNKISIAHIILSTVPMSRQSNYTAHKCSNLNPVCPLQFAENLEILPHFRSSRVFTFIVAE